MDSKDTDLICGVCKKMMSDPYILPCGHSFCLRPCLLPQDRVSTARCINCDVKFDATKLRPNHEAALHICLISLQREQEKEMKLEKEQQDQNQQAKSEGEVKKQALADAKENLKAHIEHLKASVTSELDMEGCTGDGIICSLESAIADLQTTVSKALDDSIAKLQMDSYESIEALIQQIAGLSVEVAKIKDVHSWLKRTAILREAQEKPTPQEKDEIETINQVICVTDMLLARLINLNKASDGLRAIRASLLDRPRQQALQASRIHQELRTAVTAIERTLTRTFKTNLLRVEASALSVQRYLENLSVGIVKAQKTLLNLQHTHNLLDDEKTPVDEILRIFNEMHNIRNTAQVTREALEGSNIMNYVLSSEGIKLIQEVLDDFKVVIRKGNTDSNDKDCSRVEEPIDQSNKSE
ncbi:hypothetical protein TcWFU_009007 [Taenia crassiceps]|uniref:RING-type domain-containing protein n=1 Tax=Taenia crassiceps TaxID=6207 RepID=A0ABR4QT86_9CEST